MSCKVKPNEPIKAWAKTTFMKRLLDSAGILYCHGFITDGERKKIHERMLKWKAGQIAGREE